MRRFGEFRRRHCLEVAVVVVPLLAILVLQYVSSRRLAEVEVIAHQTGVAQYLDEVAANVRSVYEDAAHEMLNVPGDVVVARRFDEVVGHFARTAHRTYIDGPAIVCGRARWVSVSHALLRSDNR